MESVRVGQKAKQHHFVLVHGSGHGGWCWYKLRPLLERSGHRVTTIDLAASGTETEELEKLDGFNEYNLPLMVFMDCLPPDEQVVLVGHNLGGINIALAADEFPDRVAAAIFVAAFVPDTVHAPSFPLKKYEEITPAETWMDTEFRLFGSPERPMDSMLFGPNFLASKLYHCSPIEDVVLAENLVRRSSVFGDDLSRQEPLSKQGYGSVKRAYIKCKGDRVMSPGFQSWMVRNAGVSLVGEVVYADHMAMISSPYQLSIVLQLVVREILSN